MKCPTCETQLESTAYEGIEIETCPSCGGEWLDDKELRHIVKVREVRFTEQERWAMIEAPTIAGIKLEDEDRGLRCPKCGAATEPINYGHDSGIIIDRCTACRGIWLDSTELEKVQTLVEGWRDRLPEMLAKYGDRLRAIEAEWEKADDVHVSRFGFVNALINGILDVLR